MAIRVLDLRKKKELMIFINTPKEEIRYAEAFWQSVKLQPTIESRLVSSDIKQRLGTKYSTAHTTTQQPGFSACQASRGSDKKLNELFTRARTLEEVARFEKLRKLAELRIQDRNMLHKRREERMQKEQISRNKVQKPVSIEEMEVEKANMIRKIGEAYTIEEMIRDIEEFEKKIGVGDKQNPKMFQCPKEKCEEPELTVKVMPMEQLQDSDKNQEVLINISKDCSC